MSVQVYYEVFLGWKLSPIITWRGFGIMSWVEKMEKLISGGGVRTSIGHSSSNINEMIRSVLNFLFFYFLR